MVREDGVPTQQRWISSCKPVTSIEPSESCTITWRTNGFPAEVQTLDTWLGRLSDEDIRAHRARMVDYALALGLAGRIEEQGWWLAQASSAAGDRDADFEIRLAGVDAQWHGMRGEPDPVLAFEREVFSRLTPGTDFVLDQFPVLSSRAHLYKGDPVSCIATCDLALESCRPSHGCGAIGDQVWCPLRPRSATTGANRGERCDRSRTCTRRRTPRWPL